MIRELLNMTNSLQKHGKLFSTVLDSIWLSLLFCPLLFPGIISFENEMEVSQPQNESTVLISK